MKETIIFAAVSTGKETQSLIFNGTQYDICMGVCGLINSLQEQMPMVAEALNLTKWEANKELMPGITAIKNVGRITLPD